MEIDLPETVAVVKAAFERYEHALVTNDASVLDKTFRDDPRTTRYGQADIEYGYKEISDFRARAREGLARARCQRRSSRRLAATSRWPLLSCIVLALRGGSVASSRCGYASQKAGVSSQRM